MSINQVFIDESGRIRSGWRFAIFLSVFILLAAILGGVTASILHSVPAGFAPGSAEFLAVNGVVSLVPAVLVGWFCGKYLEALPFKALGASFTEGWLKHLILGIVIGAATLAIAVLMALISGGLSFQFNSEAGTSAIISTLAVSSLIFAVAAAFEEVFFRGYMLQTFARAGYAWLAIALTSAFFGSVHMGNPDAGIISTLNTIFAGVWFGIAYLKTRDLWFVLGLHLMWNWMQGAFFGIEVSGLKQIVTDPLLKEIDRGPVWLTGENYGIEGGIACTVAIVISITAIYFIPFLKPSDEMLELTSQNRER